MKPHHTKEFRLMRSVSLWLHNFICYNCNEQNYSCDIHHLDHDNRNNKLENLAPLCYGCHKIFHRIPKQNQISYKRLVVLLLRKVTIYSK